MADNKELVSMAQAFTGLPMDALIGAPLNASVNANAAMAITQTKFILDTGFAKIGSGDKVEYKPIMITMSITRDVLTPVGTGKDQKTTIQNVTTTFDLPLITIIPINSLGVDNVNVHFEMEVTSSYVEDQSDTAQNDYNISSDFDVKAGWWLVSASVTGTASYDRTDSSTHATHYQKSNSAKYVVDVHAGQLPLPTGVNTIIQAYTNAIQPITMPVVASGGSSGGGSGTN